MNPSTRFIANAAVAVFCAFGVQDASAQSYPVKPIRIIVPYPAGGVVDALIRGVGQQVADTIGQPVIIDNRPGANTIIALEACAKAVSDGYTLCSSSADGMSFNPGLYASLPYDPDRDFAPITQLVWVNGAILASPGVPFSTVKEALAYAKGRPGVLNWASFGIGSTPQIYLEWFKKQAGVDIVHVPYKGSAQIIPALMSGEVQITFFGLGGPVLPQVRAGKLKVLAITSPKRSPLLPDIPTLAEQGIDPVITSWIGVLAPARTPRAVVERLNGEFVKAMRNPRFQEQLVKTQAYDAVGNTPEEFAEFLKTDRANARQVVKLAGIRLEQAAQPEAKQ
jgi:tripartite-type tricarboxylate transporter receptor subunit TctC